MTEESINGGIFDIKFDTCMSILLILCSLNLTLGYIILNVVAGKVLYTKNMYGIE